MKVKLPFLPIRSGTFFAAKLLIMSMKVRFRLVSALAGLAAAYAGGCADHQPVYVAPPPVAGTYIPDQTLPAAPAPVEPPPGTAVAASQPPPAPPVEAALPPAPGPGYVWTTGYWNWNGAAWVYAPGVWVLPPFHGTVWFGGHWVFRGGRHVWVRGHWR
jgi:hypothetical protein